MENIRITAQTFLIIKDPLDDLLTAQLVLFTETLVHNANIPIVRASWKVWLNFEA
jgi:hypothetical protein